MANQNVYDLLGIGIGPFNLGLAALASELPELSCLFLDTNPHFAWHPGLLIPGTRMQVPFYADLVTLANPQSPFSYLCYLKAKGRTYGLGTSEQLFPLRKEFNDYCQWVASKLSTLQFGYYCEEVEYNAVKNYYQVTATNTKDNTSHVFHAKHLVIGTGTTPFLPECAQLSHSLIFHSASYLPKKAALQNAPSITILGSGQSAAEIFYDLLSSTAPDHATNPIQQPLTWITRSGFWPMDYSKFALEMSSPEYIDYFFHLPPRARQKLLGQQHLLYKGINKTLIDQLYDLLYQSRVEHPDTITPQLLSSCDLRTVTIAPDQSLHLELMHTDTGKRFSHHTHALILATGYQHHAPDLLWPLTTHIRWAPDGGYQVNRDYSIDKNRRIFVQNADLHTHGFNSADLGLGPYRNAVILNTILGHEHFPLEKAHPFQTFGPPQKRESW